MQLKPLTYDTWEPITDKANGGEGPQTAKQRHTGRRRFYVLLAVVASDLGELVAHGAAAVAASHASAVCRAPPISAVGFAHRPLAAAVRMLHTSTKSIRSCQQAGQRVGGGHAVTDDARSMKSA